MWNRGTRYTEPNFDIFIINVKIQGLHFRKAFCNEVSLIVKLKSWTLGM